MLKDAVVVNPKDLKKIKQKKSGTGKEATFKELEAIKRQRIAQKRFMKTEVVSRELMNLSYGLLDYLQKMRTCSYKVKSIKAGKYNTTVEVTYMASKDGK